MRYLFLYCLFLIGCAPAATNDHHQPNALIQSSSPYLLQHAYNPVNWYPWADSVLHKAREEDKLMIISIGYAACHWCHVMERESFEDTTVARIMNENYVSVKVDREERPDVDQVYMDAAMLINGQGGWPLNVIALPDGRPVHAGTYYPKEQWIKTLDYFRNVYRKKPRMLRAQANRVEEGLNDLALLPPESNERVQFTAAAVSRTTESVIQSVSLQQGGRKGAPKFPTPVVYEYLLRYAYHTADPAALEAVTVTLDNMAAGGIYDHLGGGFSRYAVDAAWKVPHFEKMLYDNAQLISLYASAYRFTGQPGYRKIVQETINFLERELKQESGLFASSRNADSEGQEGKYYTWTARELQALLQQNYKNFASYYSVKDTGNWEHNRNILFLSNVKAVHQPVPDRVQQGRNRLLRQRKERIPPSTDTKCLAAWNAMLIQAYLDAATALNKTDYVTRATQLAAQLRSLYRNPSGGLYRNYMNGEASINGFLDDYAFSIRAFIALYEHTFKTDYLNEANRLTQFVINHFSADSTALFYYSAENDLVVRKKEMEDAVMPSSNAVMMENLYRLGTLLDEPSYRERAITAWQLVQPLVEQDPSFYTHWLNGQLNEVFPFYEVAIVGENLRSVRQHFQYQYLPNTIFLGSKQEGKLTLLKNKWVKGKTMIYVCQDKFCKQPVQQVKSALEQVKKLNQGGL